MALEPNISIFSPQTDVLIEALFDSLTVKTY